MAFQTQAMERICEENLICDPDFDCNDLVGFGDLADVCTFDIDNAQLCLDGAFTCNEEFSYAEGPEECSEVYRCIDGFS